MSDDYTPGTAHFRELIEQSAAVMSELAPELGMTVAAPDAVMAGFDRWFAEVRADAVMGFATHYLPHALWVKAKQYADDIREGNA